ncbi:hypothetical protein [Streptomyces werraensis]|uniref:hypothetical protein n=1 Tax=Streptomyces werraensis TaxID=68284 RepID=UPI003435C183
MRTEVQGWTIVHHKRVLWRGAYDGVFLGERDGNWIAGRMWAGKSMDDGFSEDGEWWYASYYDSPHEHEAGKAMSALDRYIRLAEDAGNCWDGMFNQRAGEAIDRHWARRVPLDQVADMSAAWVHSDLCGEVRHVFYLMPAVEAKNELLGLMRRSARVRDVFRDNSRIEPGSELASAYDVVLGATGQVGVQINGDRFSLSFGGRYNNDDERWRTKWTRNPHPSRKEIV